MYLLSRERLVAYATTDRISIALAATEKPGDSDFISQRWLLESAPKRLMYDAVYGDLLDPGAKRQRILDIGGGFCSLTRLLLQQHDYTLVEINAHDIGDGLRRIEREMGTSFWLPGDWYAQALEGPYDVVVANDLFPNVDQRLDMFLQKFLPISCEMRLSLTYFDAPHFYMARRLDGEEVLCMLAWNGQQVRDVLLKYADNIVNAYFDILTGSAESIFENQRQVCIVSLQRDLRSPCGG